MGAASGAIEYPVLPLETGAPLRMLSGVLWCLAAALIHGGLYFAALTAREGQRSAPTSRRDPSADRIMIVTDMNVDPPAPPEPVREVAPVPTVEEMVVAKVDRPVTEAARPRERPAPPSPPPVRDAEETPPAAEAEAFRDIGVMGSVDIGATGPGGSSFSVAVGTSGIGGPIGRSGRVEGIATPGGRGRQGGRGPVAAPPAAETAVSIRNLSRRAEPDVVHNRRIKAPYPEQLRAEAISGEVQAVLIVLPDGTVGRVRILKSAHEAFAASAIAVLKQFLFAPALDKQGEAVTSKVKLTYRFTLE